MSDSVRNRTLRAAKRAWRSISRFGTGTSLRMAKGRDEVVIHFTIDGRMRAAFRNGKRMNGGGLPRIAELFEEGK